MTIPNPKRSMKTVNKSANLALCFIGVAQCCKPSNVACAHVANA